MALREDGSVAAWGGNGWGQCNVPPGLTATAIAAGRYFSLALREDGSVVAWGLNDYGQCNVPPGLTATAIAAGDWHSLAIREDGSVVGWTRTPADPSIAVPGGLIAIAIEAGSIYCLAIREDGSVVKWSVSGTTYEVPPGLIAQQVAQSSWHDSFAIRPDYEAVSWGTSVLPLPPGLIATAISAGEDLALAIKYYPPPPPRSRRRRAAWMNMERPAFF